MSFATVSQDQQQKPQQNPRQKKKKPKPATPLPTSYITAQNCFSNFTELKQESAQRASTTIETAAPMIKNIDTTITTSPNTTIQQTDWDDKQKEENEACKGLERRNSVSEEFPAAQDTTTIIETTKKCQQLISTECTDLCTITTSEATTTTTTILSSIDLSSEDNKSNLPTNYLDETITPTNIINAVTENLLTEEDSSIISESGDNSLKLERRRTPSPSISLECYHRKSKESIDWKDKISTQSDEADAISKSSDNYDQESQASNLFGALLVNSYAAAEKFKNSSRLSERAKKKSWYNVLYPSYKSRADDFKKLFKEVPNDERLIVDYSCALQRDILVQGRLYVSQNYVCFHANIFRWETYLCIKWKDVTSITKEKTALVIPNAISISTANDKYFFATFATRDKAFLMLFRVWQNTLMNRPMLPQEMWQFVHDCYGDELGLTTDDEDYIDPAKATTTTETEGEIDFSSALEDSISLNSVNVQTTDYNTATSSLNIFPILGSSSTTSSGSASANVVYTTASASALVKSQDPSVGGGGNILAKSKKSYFFNTNKSSSATSSSDNKASDNNIGSDRKKITMKSHAKELTLISAEPDENTAATEGDGDGGGGGGGGVASSDIIAAKDYIKKNGSGSGSASAKEPKNSISDGKRKVSKNTRQRDEALAKTTQAIPTDISQSSDSEDDKIPFVVTAECSSNHEGRQLVHTILPINVDTLFNMLFSKSKFLVDFHAMRKSTDVNFPDWTTANDVQKVRTVNLTVQLAASVGPKQSKVTEHQVMRDCSKPGELYSIDVNTVNAGIPYADSFSVLIHYCLVRTIDDHTMLSVHAQIKYKKSIWGVVKGFIEKNTWAGLEDFFTSLLHSLQSETCIPPAKGKGRRPRRGVNAIQARPCDDVNAVATLALGKNENSECLSSANPQNLPNVVTTNQDMVGSLPKSKYRWLSSFVILLLLFLIAVNVMLLTKLWKLETRIEEDINSRSRMPNLSSLKQLPSSHKEWIDLLRQQEILHETELRKWHKVLQTAIELLKKTEKTLAELLFR